jgi:predicted RNase H-like HicB family nuclease
MNGVDLQLTAVLTPEDDIVVAVCPELDVASQGATDDEALANLQEALGLLLEDITPDELRRRYQPGRVQTIQVA